MKNYILELRDFLISHYPSEKLEEYPCFDIYELHKLKKLKGKYKGERCFIIGNGPSLKNTDLSLLDNEYTFGFNGICINDFGFKPYFYMATDVNVFKQFPDGFYEFYKNKAFFPVKFKKSIETKDKNNKYYFKVNRGYHIESSINYKKPRFSNNAIEKIYEGPSVVFYCLQLAYYLGFTEVNLVGVDFDYTLETHFSSNYKDGCKRWCKPDDNDLLNCLNLANLKYVENDRVIYDLTINGKLPLFKKKDYYDYLS